MPLWVPALAVCLVALVAGIGYAAWRGLQLWRGAKATMRVLGSGGRHIEDGLDELTRSADVLAAAPGKVGAAGADLQRSVAAARVVVDAMIEARSGIVVPRLRRRRPALQTSARR